ncbi:MAG TPA: hypothetical protein VND45_11090 [Thermoanaerobaculia bacterium]|jgi:hypothetical protein|nr:hypothetical protein [Thermoanaerobaculia bacterium]
MTARSFLLLFAATSALALSAAGQSCPSSCQPVSNGKQGPTNSTITIAFGSGFTSAQMSAFQDGIEMWNSSFLQTWTNLWFSTNTYGPADIIIVIDPTLQNGALNVTDTNGNGEIRVASSALGYGHDFLAHLMAHELGHSRGFENVSGGGCDVRSIMYFSIDPYGYHFSSIPPCEQIAVSNSYPTYTPPPPPADELQHNGSPIVLDLSGDGYRMTSVADGVTFDLRNDGQARLVAWTRHDTQQAFLGLDRDGNGMIDNGGELFGNYTPLQSGALAQNGFEALRELDENGDRKVDELDPAWQSLVLWTDENHDGVSSPGECQPIAASVVVALETDYRHIGRSDRWNNYYSYMAHFWIRRGASTARRIYFDVFLRIAE